MRVSAILVVNDRPKATSAADESGTGEGLLSKGSMAGAEIMGQSILERSVTRLYETGIRTISVIAGPAVPVLRRHTGLEITVADTSFARWLAAQQTLLEHGTRGMDTVLMIGLGAYLEWNVTETLKAHFSTGAPLTQLEDSEGPLDFWVVDSKWFRTAATGCKLPFRYGEFPGLPMSCPMNGYVNRLASAHDLRRLVRDAFSGRCEIVPAGRQIRPGIWLDDGARVHRRSRLVAPAYVGRGTTVGSSAVVTRFSNLERNCQIGEGTVIDETTILPHTALGSSLDVSRAVVDRSQFVDLDRNVAFQINDPKLLSDITPKTWRVPRHRRFPENLDRGKNDLRFEYSQYWTRAAGRLSEVLFKG